MGGHYGTIHVKTDDRDAVRSAVERLELPDIRRFFIAPPIDGWVTIFPEGNGQDAAVSEELVSKLPDRTLIHCLVYDDDIFAYWLYEKGRCVDTYNSCPEYFDEPKPPPRGGNAHAFSDLLLAPHKPAELQALLDAPRFDFELERQDQFAAMLGLPNTASAYEYLQSGETDGVRQWKKFIHIPDLAPEKAARRATAAKERAEFKGLQQEGLLLVQQTAERSANKHFFKAPFWTINPADSSVLLAWQDHVAFTGPGAGNSQWLRFRPPEWEEEAWDAPPTPPGTQLQFSPTGSILALQLPDGSLEIRAAGENRLIARKPAAGRVVTMAFAPDERWLFVVTNSSDSQDTHLHRLALQPGLEDAVLADSKLRFQAVTPHPDGRLLALVDNFGILVVVDGQTMKLINQVWIKETHSPLPEAMREEVLRRAASKLESGVSNFISAEELERSREDCARHFLPKEPIRLCCFDSQGHWLFCGTGGGLRGLVWDEVLLCPEMQSVPVRLSADSEPMVSPVTGRQAMEHKLVYGVAYDALRQRVLFCGLEGKLSFFDLSTRRSGDLLLSPGRRPLIQLALTPDRRAIVATAHQFDFETRKQTPCFFQVWSYPVLCRASGLEH